MTFQEQLNLYIEELSCSGRELAQNSGISETILSRYRKGERLPGADSDYLKKRVCQVFCVSFKKIFWGGSPPHSYIAKLLKINSLKHSL